MTVSTPGVDMVVGEAAIWYNVSMRIDIRPETKRDYAAIRKVNNLAFGGESESSLIEALRKTKRYVPDLSLVARHCDKVVGYILFYPVDIAHGDKKIETLALAPMSVLPEHQNKGIGSKLVKVGLSKAKKMGFRSVIVLGHQRYYPRFGFKTASAWGIAPPFEAPAEVFMALELDPGALQDAAGTVEYPAPFSAL